MKIYIAARYGRKAEIAKVAAHLRICGFEITSTWQDEPENDAFRPFESRNDHLAADASRDLCEISSANLLLFYVYAESDQYANRRGGRHVEFGYALGIGKAIAVIGPMENIFHHISWVRHYPSLGDFIQHHWPPSAPKQLAEQNSQQGRPTNLEG